MSDGKKVKRWWIEDNEANREVPADVAKPRYVEVIEAEPVLARIKQLESQLKEAEEVIRFYASGKHFEWLGKEEFAPENPSGEPSNIECGGDLDCEFTLENGGIAREYMKKWEEK